MGWCHEFGPQIAETCEHPMTAHSDHCECTVCGTICTGRFAGCGAVWARGPREVAVSAPHVNAEPVATPEVRWRLPLENVAPAAAPQPVVLAEPQTEIATADAPAYETPDVTTRFAVAQLEELNSQVSSLTDATLQRTEAAIEKVYGELRRLASQREVDLTEQAAGIFGAVQASTDALAAFTKIVGEVTDDLRTILSDSLKAIGGTDGLAAWVAASAADIKETRAEFAASLGKIERDLTLLRRRSNADSKPAKLDDDQVAFIVDAVTDAVLAALENKGRRR